jgi:hypothetical protein
MLSPVPVPFDECHELTNGALLHDRNDVTYFPQTVPPYKFRALGGETICVCRAEFSDVRRYRDFCRIEAVVRVVFQIQPSLHTLDISILTNAPIPQTKVGGHLRLRMIRNAINLALHLPRLEQERLLISA